jgi:hypothetical protein
MHRNWKLGLVAAFAAATVAVGSHVTAQPQPGTSLTLTKLPTWEQMNNDQKIAYLKMNLDAERAKNNELHTANNELAARLKKVEEYLEYKKSDCQSKTMVKDFKNNAYWDKWSVCVGH